MWHVIRSLCYMKKLTLHRGPHTNTEICQNWMLGVECLHKHVVYELACVPLISVLFQRGRSILKSGGGASYTHAREWYDSVWKTPESRGAAAPLPPLLLPHCFYKFKFEANTILICPGILLLTCTASTPQPSLLVHLTAWSNLSGSFLYRMWQTPVGLMITARVVIECVYYAGWFSSVHVSYWTYILIFYHPNSKYLSTQILL